MKAFITSFIILFLSISAQAGVVTESETGFINSRRSCKITLVETSNISFREGFYGELAAEVVFKFSCIKPNGKIIQGRGKDRVNFRETVYNWDSHNWEIDATPTARRLSRRHAELFEGIAPIVWIDINAYSIGFYLTLERPDEID